jgi:arginyl-tRNA synthetase
MTTLQQDIRSSVKQALATLYGAELPDTQIQVAPTRKEFEGHFTVMCFPFSKVAGKKPQDVAQDLGVYLAETFDFISSFNVIQGFLNLVIADSYWLAFLKQAAAPGFGSHPSTGKTMMVEFSSPNTNKPLHLGHVRNILLGWSTAQLLQNAGHKVIKAQVINDRGIAICKSMLAWQLFADGATPASMQKKSDHFVGHWYVFFEQKFREEYAAWQSTAAAQAVIEAKNTKNESPEDYFKAFKNTYFNEYSDLGKQARAMLLRWEAHDPDTLALWKKMNQWVYEGFDQTYDALGVQFDKVYYESDTYLLGKDLIAQGVETGVFYAKPDGSVWIDLTDEKLDHKLVLRSDGTSVYITQDIGMARMRSETYGMDGSIYVVADEQDYHFQVLFAILKRMGEPYAHGLHHLSYGMVELTTGRMKSREGTVVDADDLVAEVIDMAATEAADRGDASELADSQRQEIARRVGLGALKYFILKVNPRKRMVYDPKEAIDMQGHTGPTIQYAYVRIQNVLRKGGSTTILPAGYTTLQPAERQLVNWLYHYPDHTAEAAGNHDPSILANYLYDLAKLYNQMYHDLRILQAESESAMQFRICLSSVAGQVLQHGMTLLGIDMPERM